ncbi:MULTISPECIES: acyltransferase [unclassified Pseudoalteromonas]|uniref:acyltransferase n=1 Tax=unclassified Pseudoalteromonas TaxID=194690 RepID=UPI0025B512C9|nr:MULTISPECIES: acyltransferase [unclassified Pseudoalteromonas]MDN3408130.1 acyltransferase [Pseudoalteromonas sp. APC 3894]MDN3415770.1 acyltransferase [Pseudoalteromonas sp. APC 3227]MDN3419468.1 acyltransferase [Pseudoalteromonas sp. APC 3895]MDN3422837.1 acyltransferase [Pseudoalteromonas sp. APC 3896]
MMIKKFFSIIRYLRFVKFNKGANSAGYVSIKKGVKIIIEEGASVYFGENVLLKERTTIYAKKNSVIQIGNNTSTGVNTEISINKSLIIGNDVLMGANTYFTDSNHGYELPDVPIRKQPMDVEGVNLGNNVWVGRGAMILKGVILGDNMIIGANAVVTKSFDGNMIIGGLPAKLIRKIYD